MKNKLLKTEEAIAVITRIAAVVRIETVSVQNQRKRERTFRK